MILVVLLSLLGAAGDWFVHHPRTWVAEQCASLQKTVSATLLWFGNPVADVTDALDLTGYDTVCEYDTEAQKMTFRMSNIAPQSPALNRKVWRDVEHRIADLWTARYGEIWVVVGSRPFLMLRPGMVLSIYCRDVPFVSIAG